MGSTLLLIPWGLVTAWAASGEKGCNSSPLADEFCAVLTAVTPRSLDLPGMAPANDRPEGYDADPQPPQRFWYPEL